MMAKFKFQNQGPSVGFGSGTKRNLTSEPSKMMVKRLPTQRYNVFSQGLVPPKRSQISQQTTPERKTAFGSGAMSSLLSLPAIQNASTASQAMNSVSSNLLKVRQPIKKVLSSQLHSATYYSSQGSSASLGSLSAPINSVKHSKSPSTSNVFEEKKTSLRIPRR